MEKEKYSVTQKIKITRQPRGGFLNPKEMRVQELEEKNELFDMNKENYSPPIIGLTVDYLTRFMVTKNAQESFKISLMGSRVLDLFKKEIFYFENEAIKHLENIDGLNEKSIHSALKLSEFDVAFRANPMFYKSNPNKPNKETIENIKNMVKNSISFFEKFGPVTKDGFIFLDKKNSKKNGYSNVVVAGDGDFLTKDTLWDFKVSKYPPTKDHTLQLLMYFLMGKKSKIKHFNDLKYIGVYNPRLNTIYKYNVSKIDSNILKSIAKEIIEYEDISFIENLY